MKKFLVILASVIAAVVTLSLTTSCQKDINLAKSLVGTTWYATYESVEYTLKFETQSTCTLATNKGAKYFGDFILAGAKRSLAGESIVITGLSWDDDFDEGRFTSDTELVLNNIAFHKGVL